MHYTAHPDYIAFLTALRANPADETTRLVFADWVQEQGDEDGAKAIRERRSVVDMLLAADALTAAFKTMGESLRPAVQAVSDALQLATARLTPTLFQPARLDEPSHTS
jgi:uncharacterized protein (TIGR02996 family)